MLFALAYATCSAKNAFNALTLMCVASMISPAISPKFAFNVSFEPSFPSNSMFTFVGFSINTDCSFALKSPEVIVTTFVLESLLQEPIECGFWRAYSFTANGALRSEFPSRITGFTALPLILS